MSEDNLCIGIDLGTTYSCIGVWRNNQVEIIPNDYGSRTTPSCVAFTSTQRLIGTAAKNQASRNPENTIFDVKRLIGRKFEDFSVQEDIKIWPFRVIRGPESRPLIVVSFKGEEKFFFAEEISAMVLAKMKETAEGFLGRTVDSAVVTIPAYFNDSQRQATKDAGEIAGIRIKRLINEPTAAAITYGLQKISFGEKHVIVFDLGGGTCDISLLTIEEGIFEVRAIAGDSHLGGSDFDNRLVDFCLSDFHQKTGINLKSMPRSLKRLQTSCEKSKRSLSSCTQTTIEIEEITPGLDYSKTLTRLKFEELNMDLFLKTLSLLNQVLQEAHLTKSQISEIVLVGGSTRIPKIQQLIQEFFNGKELCKSINPDEAVAYGAAVQAGILSIKSNETLEKILLLDVAPFSLGFETAGGVMTVLISKNMCIPVKRMENFSTFLDDQPAVIIKVFEGEGKMTKDCKLLGEFQLNGIAPAPKGVPQIEVTFQIDVDGILEVFAKDKGSGKTSGVTICCKKGRLSNQDIENFALENEKFKEMEKVERIKSEKRNQLESFIFNLKNELRVMIEMGNVDVAGFESVEEKIEEACEWLGNNLDADTQVYQDWYDEIQQVFKLVNQNRCHVASRNEGLFED